MLISIVELKQGDETYTIDEDVQEKTQTHKRRPESWKIVNKSYIKKRLNLYNNSGQKTVPGAVIQLIMAFIRVFCLGVTS